MCRNTIEMASLHNQSSLTVGLLHYSLIVPQPCNQGMTSRQDVHDSKLIS
uniref:Uncharacterized protein n=1 Tax=Rhizophora mucronata TaxID=61149 RepID=A0A2P2N9U5_RHIMU